MGKNTKKKPSAAAAASADVQPVQQQLARLLVEQKTTDIVQRLLRMTGELPEFAMLACEALFRIAQRLEPMREVIR